MFMYTMQWSYLQSDDPLKIAIPHDVETKSMFFFLRDK